MNYRKAAAGILALMLGMSSVSGSVLAEESFSEEESIEEGDAGTSSLSQAGSETEPSQGDGGAGLIEDMNTNIQSHTGEAVTEDGKSTKNAKKVIAGFAKVGLIGSISFSQDSKPSLSSLRSQFPSQVSVYFVGESDPVSLPVTWVSIGQDYSGSDNNYYLFVPQFDADKYDVVGMDQLKEAPYIEVKKDFAVDFEMITSAPPAENEKAVFEYCTQKLKLNTAAACGILANMYCESGFRTDAVGDGHTSVGLCQWHNGRWNALRGYTSDWQTVDGQLSYLGYELQGGYSGTLNYLKSVSDDAQGAYDAAYFFCLHFEMPDSARSRGMTRGYLAKNVYWPRYGEGNGDEECGCNDSFAGEYAVKAEGGLHLRSGHSSDSESVALIPDGSSVTVTKADGTWAHVTWTDGNGDGQEHQGLCRMEFLTVVSLESETEEETEEDIASGCVENTGDDGTDSIPGAESDSGAPALSSGAAAVGEMQTPDEKD